MWLQIRRYGLLGRSFWALYFAQWVQNVISTAFLLVFNILLKKQGYTDAEAGVLTSLRYLGVFVLAFPLGIWMKGSALRPFFLFSAWGVPIFSILMLWGVLSHSAWVNFLTSFFWGCATVCMQVAILPYLMRNIPYRLQTDAFALIYTNFSFSQITAGLCIGIMSGFLYLSEEKILLSLAILGFLGALIISKIEEPQSLNKSGNHIFPLSPTFTISSLSYSGLKRSFQKTNRDYDWKIIWKAMLPNFLLTIGAGLTIPYMNLFFYNVFQMGASAYAWLNFFTALLVIGGTLIVPQIKKRYGYKGSITITQTIAVLMLYLLALTDIFSMWKWAYITALLLFALRQPFMQVAVPMTRDLMMNYVGKRNQELVSALLSSFRSGSYFFSGQLFSLLSFINASFSIIFLLTATFYALGVIAYHLLILAYEKQLLLASGKPKKININDC